LTIDEILASEDPVPMLWDFLYETPVHEWSAEYAWLEELLHFHGRIYGGGLAHAIGVASDNVIPDALRLWHRFGTPEVVSLASRLESYFSGAILGHDREARQGWEAKFMEAPDAKFEALDDTAMELEIELGKAISGYVRENMDAFR
jgi:hypothetical protein